MLELTEKQKRGINIVIAYPFAILAISILVSFLLPQSADFAPHLPTSMQLSAIAIAAMLLVFNHSLLMTTTEVTRGKYKMYATPEEWKASGTRLVDIPEYAIKELERHHNAHRNSTENTCYFTLLAIPFLFFNPPLVTAYVWLVGFALARVGHTTSYLLGKDNLRGIFMSIGLICLYGMGCYIVIGGLFNAV